MRLTTLLNDRLYCYLFYTIYMQYFRTIIHIKHTHSTDKHYVYVSFAQNIVCTVGIIRTNKLFRSAAKNATIKEEKCHP